MHAPEPSHPFTDNARIALERTRCPLCNSSNTCSMEIERATGVAQEPCWCSTLTISPELLAQVPANARDQACICRACVTASAAAKNAKGATA